MSIQTILLVDDDDNIRMIAQMSLEDDWTVSPVSSGRQAIEAIRDSKPDLILLDMMMPGMDGAETIQRLKADPSSADVPVIFMTAKIQSQELAKYLELGAVGVITKPFDPMTLPDEIRRIVASIPARS